MDGLGAISDGTPVFPWLLLRRALLLAMAFLLPPAQGARDIEEMIHPMS